MSGCAYDRWSLSDLASALQDMNKGNKKIVVPMFQRGERWSRKQEDEFFDSLKKGYPVGSLLFYETIEDNKNVYILVDGLQRGNSIKNYINNPTKYFKPDSVSDDFCEKIVNILGINDINAFSSIRSIISKFIEKQNTFKNLQFYSVAKDIVDEYDAGYQPIEMIIDVISDFFKECQNLYDSIANTLIPIIVYRGDEANLPDIFDRINSKGTPLDKYEVYAASWPVNERYFIENKEVIEYVIKKYESLQKDGYIIHGFNSEEMRGNQKINAFEYLFGLSKYLINKYEILGFNKNLSDDRVNPIAFELINACLNDSDKISTLYMNFKNLNLNTLEKALCKTIEFVRDSISIIIKFKGNSRNSNKIFHSKYQILSMISTTFKEMYKNGVYDEFCESWNNIKSVISKNLVHYYVYDIITNYWSEGGTGKIHAASKPNRYMSEIASRTWMVALDSFFERSMLRSEVKKIDGPKSEEYVILNCIYLNTFTAMDQLSIEKFDVEHIAPKEQMKKLLKSCYKGEGLPISCIANLCYLPEYVNRSKKDKNFYQDKKYLKYVKLKDVEKKYSFTVEDDLEWMDMPYEKAEDFAVLKEYYTEFCVKRFNKIKHLFFDSLGITYEEIDDVHEDNKLVVSPKTNQTNKKTNFSDKCIIRFANVNDLELIRVGRSVYKTSDGKKGYLFKTSKAYKQGDREKYWFEYRRKSLNDLKSCNDIYIVYGCKDENSLVCIPVSVIEEHIKALNVSKDEDGKISHWHIVFFKDKNSNMSWLLSKPNLQEININQFVI